jgi:hypothetical protein
MDVPKQFALQQTDPIRRLKRTYLAARSSDTPRCLKTAV